MPIRPRNFGSARAPLDMQGPFNMIALGPVHTVQDSHGNDNNLRRVPFLPALKADSHDTTCRMGLSLWHMKRSVKSTISVHALQEKFKMLHLHTNLLN